MARRRLALWHLENHPADSPLGSRLAAPIRFRYNPAMPRQDKLAGFSVAVKHYLTGDRKGQTQE